MSTDAVAALRFRWPWRDYQARMRAFANARERAARRIDRWF
ncbi:MAG TPA: hypothetical protein PKZ76_09480 [Xanthomonadaceae bacterium]|nr:hypothetical protein [Xanthomonadaceae bacterium]